MKNKIYNNLIEVIGNTPLVRLNKISREFNVELIAKLEAFNPGGSIKDRACLSMIIEAEKVGIINRNTTIIEATSGNTGIGLAMITNIKGYRLILTMPETMSLERRKLLKAYGAEIVLTPGSRGMSGAIEEAERIAERTKNVFIPQQFKNVANPKIHQETTGPEIWEATKGRVDILVAGVGTGGTITGVCEYIKPKKPSFRSVAVEPFNSPVLSGGKANFHKIQGIGAGFIPDILRLDLIDEIVKVKDEEAIETTRSLAIEEGILAGISSGAATHAAIMISRKEENEGKQIVVILPDTGERYLSTDLF